MKISFLFSVLFLLSALLSNAQNDNCDKYLQWTLDCCHKGEYAQAKQWYEVYKELGCSPKKSIENLLAQDPKDKTYSVGEVIMVDTVAYTVAYIRNGGKHGLAIYNAGWGRPYTAREYEAYITRKGIPTLEELKLIYANRDVVRLYDSYWTCTRRDTSTTEYFKIKDFSTGEESDCYYKVEKAMILLIYRF